MKPRIVILSAFLTPFRSGAEACAEEVPLRLADQFDFMIITARMRKDLPKEDMLQGKIPVKRVGLGYTFDKWLYPFLAPLEAKKYNPQVIHAILETFAGEALMRCKNIMPFARRILTLQTTNRTFRKKKILQSPHVVTAISMHLAGIANEMREGGVKIIPNGIDYEAIRSACAKYPKVSGRILFVGRLERMKGVDLLLRAYARANSEFGVRNSELHIVGDGSQRSILENLAHKLGIAERVVFKGYLQSSDVNREYAEAEIFCGLSRSEALGNVFIEAQAAGCGIVHTPVGGISEIMINAGWGVPYDGKDESVTIAEATEGLSGYLNDKECLVRHKEMGIANASKYDWNLIAKRYAEVYKSTTLGQL